MPRTDDPSRDLLYGLLALQVGMIDQAQLVAAFQAWIRDKSRPMAGHLASHGALDPDQIAALEALVSLHLKKHGGDAEASLAAVPAGRSTREQLQALAHPDLTASVARVGTDTRPGQPEPTAYDADRTTTYDIGAATSGGQRFRVLRPHARGGLGAVFVALDSELPREVALKQILDHHADDPTSRQRFLLEAEITGGLEHPGIVPVYSLGTYADGRPFYAMRFIRGESLKEAIQGFHADDTLKRDPGARSLALRRLLRRFLDVCNAIDYAHGRGVLHRDIKPGNIIVGKHGETLVIDWGLAKTKAQPDGAIPSGGERLLTPSSASGSAETLPGSALGTPAYMSPEQARGDHDQLGPRSDVYSLGATLYCLLTGVPPHDGEIFDVMRAAQAGDFQPPRRRDPTIDRALEAVCLKAMAAEPDNRYPSARALADDVERWIADEPVSARREPVPARLARRARRHRTAVTALGLSLGTAVALLTVSNVLVNKARRETARALARVEEEQGHTLEALKRADVNFRRARQAVDDYFTAVSEEVLLDEPGMQGLREKLLRSALEYHEVFLKERSNDPSVEAELAESHRRIANMSTYAARQEDPLPHLQIAQERFAQLARKYPNRPEYRQEVARTLSDIGFALLQRKSERQKAIRGLREAIVIYEELLREQPENTTLLVELAKTLASLGHDRAQERGGRAEATGLMERARDIVRRIVAQQPESLSHRLRLANIHTDLYNVLVGDRRRQDEAIQSSQAALDTYRELLKRSPHAPGLKLWVGILLENRGLLYARQQRWGKAIPEMREARRYFAEITRTNPENLRYQSYLAMASSRLGGYLLERGESEAALDPLREACVSYEQLLKDPHASVSRYTYLTTLGTLGESLRHLGRFDESISVLQRAVALGTDFCRIESSDIFLRGALMQSHFRLAYSLMRSGRRHEEAVAAFREFRSIGTELFGGDNWSHGGIDATVGQIAMAYSLREVGRDQAAQQTLAAATRSIGDNAPAHYELARYEARGAERLAEAGGDARAVEALENRTLAALKRAVTFGFSDRNEARQLADLARLRDRQDFRLIELDMNFPVEPFASGR